MPSEVELATRTPWYVRFLAWLTLAVLLHMAWRVWTYTPPQPPPVKVPDIADARAYGALLQDIARTERLRSWQSPGLPSRQAAWIAVKAEHFLLRSQVLNPGVQPDANLCLSAQEQWKLLHRARALSVAGAPDIPEEAGARLRAYWSPVDGTLQPYSVALPQAYDPDVRWPLIVSLHGHGWYAPFQGHPAPVYNGAFCLAPHGRGATDYKSLGEDDVLTTIAEVCRDFPIDLDRIYIQGGSMGGTGAWNLAVHHADLFAGILPICGNADYQAWTERWGWNEPFEGRNNTLRNLLQESQTARATAGNLLNLPAYVLHGSADVIVPVGHARSTVRELLRLGCPVQYREFPNVGHGGFPGPAQDEALAWLCAQPRCSAPKRVLWAADLMRHGKAYWVRLEQKAAPLGPARIDAQAVDTMHVRITTENLTAFSLQRHSELWARGKPLFADIDGERVIFPASDEREWAELRRLDEGWRDAATLRPAIRRKQAGLEGPIEDALHSPFVLVLGTRSQDPLRRELWSREVYRFLYEWNRRNNAPCRFIRDVDCSAAIADERNLILFGGPEDNTVSAVLAPALPLDSMMRPLTAGVVAADDILLPELSAPDVGVFTVYPNPEHPQRLIVMVQGNGPEAIYQIWGRFGNWFNWGVFDSKKYFDYAVYDAVSASPESLLLVGWYGTDWGVGSGRWWRGSRAVRATMSPQVFPPFAQPPESSGRFDLMQLRPSKVDHMRGAVSFGRTFQGHGLPRSVGVRAPASIEYVLDGSWDRLLVRGILTNPDEVRLTTARRQSEKVQFTIKGDGVTLASGTASWDQPPVPLEALLKGVKTLRLETAPAGGPAWLHMGCAWLVPRLYRPTPELTAQ